MRAWEVGIVVVAAIATGCSVTNASDDSPDPVLDTYSFEGRWMSRSSSQYLDCGELLEIEIVAGQKPGTVEGTGTSEMLHNWESESCPIAGVDTVAVRGTQTQKLGTPRDHIGYFGDIAFIERGVTRTCRCGMATCWRSTD